MQNVAGGSCGLHEVGPEERSCGCFQNNRIFRAELFYVAPEVVALRKKLHLPSFSIRHRDGRMFCVPIETVKSLDHDLLLNLWGEKRFRIPWWLKAGGQPCLHTTIRGPKGRYDRWAHRSSVRMQQVTDQTP